MAWERREGRDPLYFLSAVLHPCCLLRLSSLHQAIWIRWLSGSGSSTRNFRLRAIANGVPGQSPSRGPRGNWSSLQASLTDFDSTQFTRLLTSMFHSGGSKGRIKASAGPGAMPTAGPLHTYNQLTACWLHRAVTLPRRLGLILSWTVLWISVKC